MASDHDAMRRAHEHFDPIAERELTLPDVDMGRMFSTDGLRVGGKVYAFVPGVGAHMRMRGREMREWATVPLEQAAVWEGLVDEAREFVASLAGG